MTNPTPPSLVPPIDEASSSSVRSKRLAVDIPALRAAGRVAEESQGRQFAAQYREIKRSLIERAFSSDADNAAAKPQIIMVTSALPGDGKTFTSINLALSMARERDLSVLLIDADVQKADTTNLFGLRPERGLLDALTDESVDIESLVVRTNLPGLNLLPAGTPTENATELLSSRRMRQIATSLITSQPRRLVILDAPPLLITSESRALIRVAGQVLLVVRSGKTPLHAVQEMVRFFDDRKPVGLVLNETRRGLTQGYDGYGYYGADYGDSTRTS